MIIKKTRNSGYIWLCALASFIMAAPVCADESDAVNNRSWYLGAGLGVTELDPDTNSTGYSVTDERDTGFKLFGGYDINERLTVEGFYTDLGSAQIGGHIIKPDGVVDYSTLGASALWYFWRNEKNEGKELRKGLQAYVHGGLSFLNNSASVDYSQDNSVQVQYGAALEYGLNNGVALRAGIDLYDKDAGMVFVGVLKRFGTKPKRKINTEPVVETAAEPVMETVAARQVEVPEVVLSYDLDSDQDGVYDRNDECAESPAGISVDDKGCSDVGIELKGVNFEPQSFELTEQSKAILGEAAIRINASPEIQKIEVQAHTDNRGSENYNLKLSERRAESVRTYLVSQGVNERRLVAKGYGESQPVADNKTEEGRALNRRVELKAAKDEAPEAAIEAPETESSGVEKPVQ